MGEELKHYVKPAEEHVSLGRTLRGVLFAVPAAAVGLFFFTSATREAVLPFLAVPAAFFAVFLWYVLVSGVRVAAQWERGVVLFLGKFRSVKGPGLLYIIPVLESVRFIDTRVIVLNISNKSLMAGVGLFLTSADQHHLCQTSGRPVPWSTPWFCSALNDPRLIRAACANENPTSRVEATSTRS